MTTEILQPTTENIIRAGELIRNGGLVAFPTETVYGLGCDGLNVDACERIYIAKGRPANKPLTLQVANFEQVENLAIINDVAKKLFEAFCPGPLTIILPKRDIVPDYVTCGSKSVGIRIPDNKIAQDLIKVAGCPIAAPSANISGQIAPVTANEVFDNLNGRIEIILDGGRCPLGISSTVVDVTDGVKILRMGAISIDAIKNNLSR